MLTCTLLMGWHIHPLLLSSVEIKHRVKTKLNHIKYHFDTHTVAPNTIYTLNKDSFYLVAALIG